MASCTGHLLVYGKLAVYPLCAPAVNCVPLSQRDRGRPKVQKFHVSRPAPGDAGLTAHEFWSNYVVYAGNAVKVELRKGAYSHYKPVGVDRYCPAVC